MKTITALTVQAKDKSRVNLFLDNQFYCGLDMETVLKHGLKVGTIIVEERLAGIQAESEKQVAYNKALKLISTRYKTQREVEKYLYEKGYLTNVVYYVISKLLEYNYIDDLRYAESFVSAHKATCGKLILKVVKERLIELVLNDEDFEQNNEIISLAKKYMRNKEKTKESFMKLFKYLMSKGFEYEEIKSVLKQGEIDFDDI